MLEGRPVPVGEVFRELVDLRTVPYSLDLDQDIPNDITDSGEYPDITDYEGEILNLIDIQNVDDLDIPAKAAIEESIFGDGPLEGLSSLVDLKIDV